MLNIGTITIILKMIYSGVWNVQQKSSPKNIVNGTSINTTKVKNNTGIFQYVKNELYGSIIGIKFIYVFLNYANNYISLFI